MQSLRVHPELRASRLIITLLMVAAVACNGLLAAPRAAPSHGPVPPRIVNKVIDLLDEPVIVDTGSGPATWMSEPFDTSRFSWIGLRSSGEPISEDTWLGCSTIWQYDAEDQPSPGFPSTVGGHRCNPRLPLSCPEGPTDYSRVTGLRARIVCTCGYAGLIVDPDPAPPDCAARFSDVKVLLRRH